jgi:cell wall-associated NlpC family hydrolase
MRSFNSGSSPRRTAAFLCAALAVLFLCLPDAEARPSRQRKRAPFSVALQPFSLVRSVVHTVAAPVVHKAPRILAATAMAPIKVAYYAPSRLRPRAPRAEQVYEEDEDSEVKPIRVAYQVPGRGRTAAPQQEDYDYDQEPDQEQDQDEEDESGQIERRGDRPTVSGSRAVLRYGVAYAPSRAPQSVKNAIWAANTLRRKPYVWGGGHGSFYDRGYDCSGTVSFALHGGGMLNSPLPSSELMRYGERGRGRWITIYSRPGHTFAVIAGLRLDTTDLGRGGDVGPRWYADGRDTGGYVARHPVGM